MKKYPESIMRDLRNRIGLKPDDKSQDGELRKLTPSEAFSEVCQWSGLLGNYDYVIKRWVREIYGVDLDATK